MILFILLIATILHTSYSKVILYDAFIYNGELEILLLRLHILNSTIDQFILAESDCTFSSSPKSKYYHDRDQYNVNILPYIHRITYVFAAQ